MAIKTLIFAFLFFSFLLHSHAQLSLNYYATTCPNISTIVSQQTSLIGLTNPTLVAGFLQLFFHDCFVRGCDGSVLINSTANNVAEMDAPLNEFLNGLNEIETIKTVVEEHCPDVVSCADILALATRDAVKLGGGPSWDVLLGRRDGRVSLASEAAFNLPSPTNNITQLITLFAKKGLNSTDLAILSGAHTIGVSHCNSTLSTPDGQNPSLDPTYAATVKLQCTASSLFGSNSSNIVAMDAITPIVFDNNYYVDVNSNAGLFASDAALLQNSVTRAYVTSHVSLSSNSGFFADFSTAMVKLGNIPRLIGSGSGSGSEIRKVCSAVNS